MLTTADLTGDDLWDAHSTLEICRSGMLYTTDTGYAVYDLVALPTNDHKELTDRLVEHDLIAVGLPARALLDDGTYTTAQLDITDAGERFLDQLTTALGL
ncbi:hypothetical protein [Amycolatopsis magusensis]|uniref:hypothetical protein n=1 Tax=Amycolatopsis magusensis TaxID=882444 RepID=UPI00379177E5